MGEWEEAGTPARTHLHTLKSDPTSLPHQGPGLSKQHVRLQCAERLRERILGSPAPREILEAPSLRKRGEGPQVATRQDAVQTGVQVGQAWQGLVMARGVASRPQSGGLGCWGAGRQGQERLNSNKSETERQGQEETATDADTTLPHHPPHTHSERHRQTRDRGRAQGDRRQDRLLSGMRREGKGVS